MATEPSWAEVIRGALESHTASMHTITVGRVDSYDALTQTANVQPVMQRAFNVEGNTEFEKLPLIFNVPVIWPRAGGAFIHLPLAKDDHVVLGFTDTDIAPWRTTGSESEPDDLRRHSLSNAIAFAGITHATGVLSVNPLDIAMRALGLVLGIDGGDAVIGFSSAGIQLGRGPVVLPVALAPPVDANFATLNAAIAAVAAAVSGLTTAFTTHIHPASAGTTSATVTVPVVGTPSPSALSATASTLVTAQQ